MSDEYARKMAQLVVAQMLGNKGIEGVQHSALEVLEDLLIRYINDLGQHIHSNAEVARRTSCNPLDVIVSLNLQGVTVDALEECLTSMPDLDFPQPVCNFPIPKGVNFPPSFAETKEDPPAKVPKFFPALPDAHAFIETDEFLSSKNTVPEQMKKIVEQRDTIVDALVSTHDRSVSPEAMEKFDHQITGREPNAEQEARKNNLFLMPPTWEENTADIDILDNIDSSKMRTEVIPSTEEKKSALEFQGKPTNTDVPRDAKEMFTWTWIGGLDANNMLAKSGGKLPSTYDAESLADKRRVEDLLTKNIGEEEREPQIADLDMDFADEEEIL